MRFRVVIEVEGRRRTKYIEIDPETVARRHAERLGGRIIELERIDAPPAPPPAPALAPAPPPAPVIYAAPRVHMPRHARRTSSFSKLCLLTGFLGTVAGLGLIGYAFLWPDPTVDLDMRGQLGGLGMIAAVSFGIFWIGTIIARWWTYD